MPIATRQRQMAGGTALGGRSTGTAGLRPPVHPRRLRRWIDAAAASIGVGMALIVGPDGTPAWRALRLLLVAALAVGLAVAERRRGRRFVDTASVAIGGVALPVGATIGFSYLTTTGLSARAVGGMLAGAGGLVALVGGGADLLRAARGWRRLVAVPAVLVVAYTVALPLSVAVYATNVPRPAVGSATPADRGLAYEDATMRTRDGVTLSGWYVPSANGAAVVLLHGASSTRADVLDQAAPLARHGYGVLLVDARGHGRSGGRAMELGWEGDRDVTAAVTYLRARPDVDPGRIGAVGMSMGGEEALGALAADGRIGAVVAEGATNRTFADKVWLAAAYGLRGRVQQGLDWLTYGLADLLSGSRPPISLRHAVAAAAPRPVLLIAAGKVGDEVKAAESIRGASPTTAELWVVAVAAHTGGLRTQPEEWERRVTAFLDASLPAPR